MKTFVLTIMTTFAFASIANAGCEGKFKSAIIALGAVNGDSYSKVSINPELIDDSKYTSTYQGTAVDADGTRIVFEVETKKSCEVVRIQSLGET